jgi:hypothetical protein
VLDDPQGEPGQVVGCLIYLMLGMNECGLIFLAQGLGRNLLLANRSHGRIVLFCAGHLLLDAFRDVDQELGEG